ncbi:MAG: amidohydrolase [Gemmatimonadetes bacterium]|nr:amidohydrolase [Gemmatimonadota bacterium]
MRLVQTTARLLVVLWVGAGCSAAPAPESEILLYNGKVFTAALEGTPWAEALLIKGERIIRVGSTADLKAAAGPATRSIDLGGRTVVPGFNDAHDHINPARPGVEFATGPSPTPDPGFGPVADSLAALVAREPAGTWLRTAIGERILTDPRARRAALDRIAPNHPVELQAWSGHGVILNSAALVLAGLNDSTPDPLGGWLERSQGRLTGLANEYANYAFYTALTPGAESAVRAGFELRAAAAVRWGTTTIQSMATGLDPATLARVLDSLELPIRLRMIPVPLTNSTGRIVGPWQVLKADGIKWILDGTPIERLATFRQPYSDRSGWYGRLNFPADTVKAFLAEALAAKIQPMIHAVGDSAIGVVLSAMASLAPDSVWRELRPRIEHGDGLSLDQYAAAKSFGVVIVQNSAHFALGPMALARYGAARLPTLQPAKSVLSNGIMLALGSDGPVNPFVNLMLAVIHPNNPPEALTMEQAVRAFTLGSAYAERRDRDKGRLVPGMLADLAVLSHDIFTIPPPELPKTVSVLTLVGGRPVYDPDGWLAPPK